MANEYLIMHYQSPNVPLMRDRTRPPRIVVTRIGNTIEAFGDDPIAAEQMKSQLQTKKFLNLYGKMERPLATYINGSLSYAALSDVGTLDNAAKQRIDDLRDILGVKPQNTTTRRRRGGNAR